MWFWLFVKVGLAELGFPASREGCAGSAAINPARARIFSSGALRVAAFFGDAHLGREVEGSDRVEGVAPRGTVQQLVVKVAPGFGLGRGSSERPLRFLRFSPKGTVSARVHARVCIRGN